MAVEEDDTTRTSVKTYVPTYQRDIWDDHAEELDMTRSEFVRSMVQAGRRGFDPRGDGPETTKDEITPDEVSDGRPDNPEKAGTIPQDEPFDEQVVALLEDDCKSWDDLFEEITHDIEQRLDDALDRLQEHNRIKHSGREGGYVLVE